MLDKNKLKQSQNKIRQFINEGIIQSKQPVEHTEFFMKNADDAIDSAKLLFEVSTNKEKQKTLGLTNFNGLLWVVNASYYSMFYIARAILESEGIKIKTEKSIHSVTFDAIIHYFYLTGRLQKELIEDYINAKEDSTEILGKQKADELIEDYFLEKRKRGSFTYNMGSILIKTKAKTSLQRARKFRKEIKKIILNKNK